MTRARTGSLLVAGSAAVLALSCRAGDVTPPVGNPPDTIPDQPRAQPALTFYDQPVTTAAGAMMTRVKVAIHDSGGPLRTSARDTITLVVVHDSGALPLAPWRSVPINGVASFDSVRLERARTGYRLIAGTARVNVTSDRFDIVPAAPDSLAFRVQPGDAASGTLLVPGIEVVLRDQFGNLAVNARDTVRLSLAPSASGVTLAGRLAVVPDSGVARFDSIGMTGQATGLTFQVRVGSATAVSTPFMVIPPVNIDQTPSPLALGAVFSCIVGQSSNVSCWGTNQFGELADGRALLATTPKRVAGGMVFDSIDVGSGYACGLTSVRQLYCWGGNGSGQLGDGTRLHRSTPTAVSGGLSIERARASGSTTCAISTTGPAYCWGYLRWQHDDPNADRTGSGSTVPVVKTTHALRQISIWGSTGCGLDQSGAALCWDDDTSPGVSHSSPALVSYTLFARHARCGLTSAGDLWCWPRVSDTNEGTHVAPGQTFKSLFEGSGMLCAMGTDDRIRCWNGPPTSTTPTELDFATISSDQDHTCALTAAGEAWCWGSNTRGQLGDGTTQSSVTPVRVAGGQTFRAISAQAANTCALTPSGEAWCWGDNAGGVLGEGTPSWRHTPVSWAGTDRLSSITAGASHGCGLASDGSAWCWGRNSNGQLGDGTTRNSSTPVRAAAGMRFTTLSAGGDRTCGLESGGDVWCWGALAWSEHDPANTSTRPVMVSGGIPFATIDVGGSHVSCGLSRLGIAYCWGTDYTTWNTPGGTMIAAPVATHQVFATISAGDMHACALTVAGDAWCWGYDGTDDDGRGEPPPYPGRIAASRPLSGSSRPPTMIPGGFRFRSISAGAAHTCAVDGVDRAWCWGRNPDGRLGNPATVSHTERPVEVAGGHRFSRVTAGGSYLDAHSCGTTTDGAVYCWGGGFYGQLGNGSVARSTSPSRVGAVMAVRRR